MSWLIPSSWTSIYVWKIHTFIILAIIISASHCSHSAPSPISVIFDTQFRGDDGNWSPAQIRVGSPEQWLSVFPSTVSSETWVIGPNGCDGTLTCQSLRGGLFFSNESSTWTSLGFYELGYSELSEQTDYAYYGLGDISVSDGVTVSNQTIAIINSTEYWVGHLGLGVEESLFRVDAKLPSFLSSLVQNASAIPSHSYGYTAGAYNEQKSVLGSLTLGGYDSTRFVPNGVSFSLAPAYLPVVVIDSITISSNPSQSTNLPSNWNTNPMIISGPTDTATFTIDTSTPFLWLPADICDTIASALNLTYDDSLDLYLYQNGTNPSTLSQWGLTFTFTLANSKSSADTVDLTISYNSFNHQLSYPFPGAFSSNASTVLDYFPLRRANRTEQYTIGRMFLQETYLIVDYERNNFSLSQAIFPDTSIVSPNIISITRPADSTWPGPQGSTKYISIGTIVGVSIASAVILLVTVILLCLYLRRNKKSKDLNEKPSLKKRFFGFSDAKRVSQSSGENPAELVADRRQPTEMIADVSNSRFELPSGKPPVEMPAGEVSPTFFQPLRKDTISRNDPRNPAEILPSERRNSMKKAPIPDLLRRVSDPSPVYSPQDTMATQNRRNSNSVSPYSGQNSNTFEGRNTQSSGEQVSPVTGSDKDSPSSGSITYNSLSVRSRPSPISPVTPQDYNSMILPRTSETQQTERLNVTSTDTPSISSSASHNRLSPIPSSTQSIPGRPVSSDSLFRENLIDVPNTTSLADQQLQSSIQAGTEVSRPEMVRARFSWENTL